MLQLNFKSDDDEGIAATTLLPSSLVDLREGQSGVVDRLDLPDDVARRLMELGFLPGSRVAAARSAPGGDPRVFRVDGSEIALRRETAQHIRILGFDCGDSGSPALR